MRLNFWKKDPVVSEVSENMDVVLVNENTFMPVEIATHEEESVNEDVSNNLYNKISEWVVSIGIVLLPLFFLPLTSGPLEVNKQLLLILFSGVALVLWLIGVVSSGYLKWRDNEFLKPVGAVALATLLAVLFSVSRFKSLYGVSNSLSDSFISILGLSVLYLLIVNIYDDKGKKVQVLMAISLSIVFIYGVLQLFGLHVIRFSLAKTKIFNTIGSPNSLGILAAVSLPFLHKLKHDLPYVKQHWTKIAVALAVVILVVLNWWVLWTVAIAGMFSLVALESLNSKTFKISKFIIPLMIIVLGVFLMAVKFDLPLKKNLPVEVSPSTSLSARISNSVLKDRFILGYGPENFSVAFDRYGAGSLSNTSLMDAKFYDSSSEFFNALVHGGVVLILALLFFAAFVVWNILRMHKSDVSKDDADYGVMAMMIALIVAIFLYPFNLTLMFVLYVVLSLVALILWGNNKSYFSIEKSPFLSLISSLGFIGGVTNVLVISYFGLLFYMADVKYAKALAEKDFNKKADTITEAIRWNGHSDGYYRSLSQASLNLLSAEVAKPKNDPQRGAKMQNYISSSINFAKKATELGPNEVANWANLGFVYKNLLTLVDNVDKLSEDAYSRAAELRPGDASYFYQIGNLYMNEGNLLLQLASSNQQNASAAKEKAAAAYDKAEKFLKKSLEISDNYGLAIYNLGIVYEREGKVADAVKQLEKLAPFNSNQPGLMFELGLLYYRAGRKDDAINQLQRAILLVPDYSNARWYLALIYEEKGDTNAAIEQLEKILSVEVNKGNTQVTTKLNDLKSGRKSPNKVLDQNPL